MRTPRRPGAILSMSAATLITIAMLIAADPAFAETGARPGDRIWTTPTMDVAPNRPTDVLTIVPVVAALLLALYACAVSIYGVVKPVLPGSALTVIGVVLAGAWLIADQVSVSWVTWPVLLASGLWLLWLFFYARIAIARVRMRRGLRRANGPVLIGFRRGVRPDKRLRLALGELARYGRAASAILGRSEMLGSDFSVTVDGLSATVEFSERVVGRSYRDNWFTMWVSVEGDGVPVRAKVHYLGEYEYGVVEQVEPASVTSVTAERDARTGKGVARLLSMLARTRRGGTR